ncbi:hypothetical protein C5167_038920 [Papaver somniferum]|uniref:Uncharacterized protein n=1 Tax=Papaver somniferum TaxID=3469 RepID=A0A4Y7IEP3_PAPSO|nr:hypothetical protein C5167_038920 [Papaver somniferum]
MLRVLFRFMRKLSLSIKATMGGVVGKDESLGGWIPETKLEAKMVEAMQRKAAAGTSMRSFNSVILKFPKIDESLRNCKAIFEQFGFRQSLPYRFERCLMRIQMVQ